MKLNYKICNKIIVIKLICLVFLSMIAEKQGFSMQMHVSFSEIAQSADMIFVGTVENMESRFNNQRTFIITDVLFTDIIVVRSTDRAIQSTSSSIVLKYAGGCVDGLCLDVSIAPSFQKGRRYLLFVSDDGKTYANPLVGGSYGQFEIVKDIQTEDECVLTAGRRPVLGFGTQRHKVGKLSVHLIRNGFPVPENIRSDYSEQFFTEAPIAADPSDNASLSVLFSEHETDRKFRVVTLSEFISYIKNVALTEPIAKRKLKRERQGCFIEKQDDRMVRKPFNDQMFHDRSRIIDPLVMEKLSSNGENDCFSGGFGISGAGGELGWCGYHSLPFSIEMVPEDWWSYNIISASINIWNKFMSVYQKKPADGKYGHNRKNEFCGWVDDSNMFKIYGVHWNSYLAWAHSWWSGNPCGKLIESDILFNPSYDWTSDENFAIGNSDVIYLGPLVMHESAHTWGMQRGQEGQWGYPETYDYDRLTVVHNYYSSIVENGRGIHTADVNLFRRNYSNQTDIKNLVDIGVESYYADNGLHSSETNKSSYEPGDQITLKNVTVENNSYNAVSDVRLRFFLSKDRNITTDDFQIGSYWKWDSFKKEGYNISDYDSTIPGNTPSGTYYVGMMITKNGYDDDNYTANNKTSFFSTIQINSGGTSDNDGSSKDCFLSSSVFGSPSHPYMVVLRDFKNKYLIHNALGRKIVDLYYSYSPLISDLILQFKVLKYAVRNSLIPVVFICHSILNS